VRGRNWSPSLLVVKKCKMNAERIQTISNKWVGGNKWETITPHSETPYTHTSCHKTLSYQHSCKFICIHPSASSMTQIELYYPQNNIASSTNNILHYWNDQWFLINIIWSPSCTAAPHFWKLWEGLCIIVLKGLRTIII
jgi:hypothetical protein